MKNLNKNVTKNSQKLLAMYKIILLLTVLFFINQNFSFAENNDVNFDLEDEEYVDDIPFRKTS